MSALLVSFEIVAKRLNNSFAEVWSTVCFCGGSSTKRLVDDPDAFFAGDSISSTAVFKDIKSADILF
jgi:hypothetical protein